MPRPSRSARPSLLKTLRRRLLADLIRRAAFAAAAALAALALALALFAALGAYLSPPWAACATAAIRSAGAGAFGLLAGWIGARRAPDPPLSVTQSLLETLSVRDGLTIGLPLLTGLLDGWTARRKRNREARRGA